MLRECPKPEYNLRSTWVRDQERWVTLELGVSWHTGHKRNNNRISGYYDRGVTLFTKPDFERVEGTPTSSKFLPKTVSVCIKEPRPTPKLGRLTLSKFQKMVKLSQGCRWRIEDLPSPIAVLLPQSDDKTWRIFASGEAPPRQSFGSHCLLAWDETAIYFER